MDIIYAEKVLFLEAAAWQSVPSRWILPWMNSWKQLRFCSALKKETGNLDVTRFGDLHMSIKNPEEFVEQAGFEQRILKTQKLNDGS